MSFPPALSNGEMLLFVGGEGVSESGMCDFKHECLHLSSGSPPACQSPKVIWPLTGPVNRQVSSCVFQVWPSRFSELTP